MKAAYPPSSGGGGGGSGDVVGPGSATDNRAARFDGTTGKLIQNSAVSIDDSGNVSGVGTLSTSGAITAPSISGITVSSGNLTTTGAVSCGDLSATGAITGISAADVAAVAKIASSTDNRVVRWDSTTGGVVQDSAVTIDDSGNMSGLGTLSTSGLATLGSVTSGSYTSTGTLTGFTTAKVTEDTNLYYTDVRADARIVNAFTAVLSSVISTQFGAIAPGTSATSMSGYSMCLGNTLSTDASTTLDADADGRYFSQDSSAVSGNIITTIGADGVTRTECGGSYTFVVRLSRTTNVRCFFGLGASSTNGNYGGSDTLGTQAVGAQFSTARGDTVFQAIARDNGGTQTTTAITGATVSTSTLMVRVFVASSTSVTVAIYSGATPGVLLGTQTLTTNLPQSTSALRLVVACETLTGSAITLNTYICSAVNAGFYLPVSI